MNKTRTKENKKKMTFLYNFTQNNSIFIMYKSENNYLTETDIYCTGLPIS